MSVVIPKSQLNRDGLDRLRAFVSASIRSRRIDVIPIADIKPNPRNAKRHGKKQTELLASSMGTAGFTTPLLVDENTVLLAGHARLEASKHLKLSELPVIRLLGLSEQEKIAVALADNKLAELSKWDVEICAEELGKLYCFDANLTFDPFIAGFDTAEVDRLLGTTGVDASEAVEEPADDAFPVSQAGDVWQCGPHKVVCGSATDPSTVAALMGDERAQVVFADPPYNVAVGGHVSRRKNVREFAEASGELTSEQFVHFLSQSLALMLEAMHEGALAYVCMDWRHLRELWTAAEPLFGRPTNMIVWDKETFGMGSQYRSQHEIISLFLKGRNANWCNVKPGGRSRANVWKYPGCSGGGRERDKLLALHPTPKPAAMVMDVLHDASARGGIVLDPFGGSGTTMIAAERTGRRARLIELDSLYCDTIVRRWQKITGADAVLAGTDTTFEQAQTTVLDAEV